MIPWLDLVVGIFVLDIVEVDEAVELAKVNKNFITLSNHSGTLT